MQVYQSQINNYRLKKQEEYNKKIKLEGIKEKYQNLLVMDKKLLSIIRIQRYLKKNKLYEPQNITKDDIINIPSIYRYRLKLSELNTFDFYNEYDKEMERDLLNILNKTNSSELNKINAMIDLRIYGDKPNSIVFINDKEYYLSYKQKQKIKKLWMRINPDTRSGIIFQQDLAYYRSIANDM